MDDENSIKHQLGVDANAVALCTKCGTTFARNLQIRVCSNCNAMLPEESNESPWANFKNSPQTQLKEVPRREEIEHYETKLSIQQDSFLTISWLIFGLVVTQVIALSVLVLSARIFN